ncbi:MAG: hypothetical protein ACP5RH_01555 [Leptodesmis sp.]|uniref:hypothetical protein n=1 Tax=Leptodesmis sp. TaxID=3100501 RepID=UPI003D14BD90
MTQINVIKIPCTSAIATALSFDSNNSPFCNLFDESNNLVLPIVPGGYSRTNIGPALEVVSGFVSNRVKTSTRLFKFSYIIDDARDEIRMAIEALIANATNERGRYKAITILDYIFVETLADKAQGYTLRYGALEIETIGGTVNYIDGDPTSRRIGTGHKIEFTESTRRPYGAIA